ncbi:MAG: RNA-protein complex protein Nop10 [Euryarchaeota archaeon]|nr:RNA-protein complex protein Nop10 [Euryarchaeota archaeon]
MRTSLRKCPQCIEYTLLDKCSHCECRTDVPIPPRYSPEDRYGVYRRRLRKERSGNHG